MKKYMLLGVAAFALVACEISEDPADGGFLSGVVGVAGGGYQSRIDQLEAQLASDQARANSLASEQLRLQAQSASISAQVSNLRAQYAALQSVIKSQLATLEANGVGVSAATNARARAVINTAAPGGRTDADRLAALRASISNARALSAELSRLS